MEDEGMEEQDNKTHFGGKSEGHNFAPECNCAGMEPSKSRSEAGVYC